MTDLAAVPAAKAARLLFQLPRECRVFAQIQPAAQWGWTETLLNKANFLLETLVWMKTKDAQKRIPQNKPKPFTPEFMGGNIAKETVSHTTDEIREILSKPRE